MLVVTVTLLGCQWLMRSTSVVQETGRMPWWVLGLGLYADRAGAYSEEHWFFYLIYFQF